MKPGCTLIAYLHAKPEKRDELLKVLHSFVKPSRAEPACVDYHLHVSNDDPNLFVFYENWRTRKELDEHPQTPILNSFWSRRFDLLQKDVDIQFITMLTDPDKISIAGTSRKRESQIILKTDERSIHLDLGREPKFNLLAKGRGPSSETHCGSAKQLSAQTLIEAINGADCYGATRPATVKGPCNVQRRRPDFAM